MASRKASVPCWSTYGPPVLHRTHPSCCILDLAAFAQISNAANRRYHSTKRIRRSSGVAFMHRCSSTFLHSTSRNIAPLRVHQQIETRSAVQAVLYVWFNGSPTKAHQAWRLASISDEILAMLHFGGLPVHLRYSASLHEANCSLPKELPAKVGHLNANP